MWQYIECPKCKYYESNCKNRIGTTAHTCFGFDEKMANEEWLHSLNTEQLAEWIVYVGDQCTKGCEDCVGWCDKDKVIEWLKQPHTNE